MMKLELFLLGAPQIYINQQSVTGFNTRKDLALLAYLAVTGIAHSRETLAGLLWSELPEDKARRNLRHALSHLQKVIGPHWIVTARGIALTRDLPWSVDLQILQSTVKSVTTAHPLRMGQREMQAIEALNQVLGLYRGEFLQGFYLQQAASFEEWLLAQREEARLLTLHGLAVLAERCLAQGAYDIGIAAARRLLQLEPWSEPAHCLQMQLLAQSGRRADALAQYAHCREVLATELGAEPLPTTTALYQQIKSGQYTALVTLQPPAPPVAQMVAPPISQASAPTPISVPHNLFAPLAEFIGRETELDFISRRLRADDCRLLTIVGPGGMGKSSLALALGQRLLGAQTADFPDGIFWVPLAEISATEPAQHVSTAAADANTGETILRAIATQLGGEVVGGITSTGHLQNYLRARRLLLIVDNFEHLTAGTAAVVTLLTQAPQVKMLITSRARLTVRGETVLTLDHLSLPTAAYQAAVLAAQTKPDRAIPTVVWQASEAVVMFVRRAQQVDANFAINSTTIGPVGQICQLVEGLPLGIELATSMLPLLSCHTLAVDLTKGLDILAADTRDLPYDQRTLQAVFERSWRLLSPEAQALLAKLAIFPGSFHWEAAATIVGAMLPLFQQLLNQSLVSKAGNERYILHRTVHAFAQQKLHQWPEEFEVMDRQYVHFYLDFLARQEHALTGAGYAAATAAIDTDRDNVFTAWRRAVTYGLAPELNRGLLALQLFAEQHRFHLEVIDLYEVALHHFSSERGQNSEQPAGDRALLLGLLQTFWASRLARLGRFAEAQAAYETACARLQRVDHPMASAICLASWGELLKYVNPQRGLELLTEGVRLIEKTDARWLKGLLLQLLGETEFLFGNYAEAEAQITQGCALAQQLSWARGLASAHKSLGRIKLSLGHYHQAAVDLRAGIEVAQQHRLNLLCLESTLALGEACRLQGQVAEARACFAESRRLVEALGGGLLMAPLLWEEGCLAEQCGDYAIAKARFGESLALGLPVWWSHVLPTLGWALIGLGELAQAHTYFQSVLTVAQARLPISLDAQVGVAYLAALSASVVQPSLAAQPPAPVGTVLSTVYQHPAATQETRDRIVNLAAILAVPLPSGTVVTGQ